MDTHHYRERNLHIRALLSAFGGSALVICLVLAGWRHWSADEQTLTGKTTESEPFVIPTATDSESVCAGVGPNPLRVSLPDSTVRNATPSPGGTFRDWKLYWPYGTRATIITGTAAVALPDGTLVRNGDIAEEFCAGAEGTLYWPPN